MAEQESKANTAADALEQAYADFADRFTVAFLGTRYAGKTVHCALLKDAAARRLKRHTNGKYLGVATAGAGRINRIVDALYDGQFPAKTAEGAAVQLTVEISSTENGTEIPLIFHDMAGEEYDDLLVDEMDAEERIRRILETSKVDSKPYGLMAHLIFAKVYIMLVDCSDIESWNSSQAYIKDAIRSIYEIKKRIRALHNSKVSSHLAIVFSKYDMLDDAVDVAELAKRLDEVDAAITKYMGGEVKYFKSKVDSTKLSDDEVRKAAGDKQTAQLGDATRRMAEHKGALGRAESFAAAAQDALSTATANLDSARDLGDTQLIRSCRLEYGKARKEHDEAVQACAELEDKVGKIEAEIKKITSADASPVGGASADYRPDMPLSYNADEYLDLIDWMIWLARKEAGH